MASHSARIAAMSRWTSDTETMLRLEQIVQLTQRTVLIKELMCVPDDDEPLLKIQIKAVLEKISIPYSPPRGRAGNNSPKPYSSSVRFALAVLMGLLQSSDDGGVVAGKSGRLYSLDLLDRIINTYQRYLQLNRTTPSNADVSFELFIHSWKAILDGAASIESCSNCGSSHFNFHVAPSHNCPVCAQLKLAVIARDQRPHPLSRAHGFLEFGFTNKVRQN